MTQRDNILQELRELESSLLLNASQNVYAVPAGYFDSLAEWVLNRIHALEAGKATDETAYLSPLLNGISRNMPYHVPADYFDGVLAGVKSASAEHKSVDEELQEISPLLSGLKKEMPFTVPAGYFEQLNAGARADEEKPVARVISMKKWLRYAAAAVVTGMVAVSAFLLLRKDNTTNDPELIVKQMMKKVSTDEINNFVQLADEEPHDLVAMIEPKAELKVRNEVKELVKDIPDSEIENFLDDTQPEEINNSSDDILMN